MLSDPALFFNVIFSNGFFMIRSFMVTYWFCCFTVTVISFLGITLV